MRRQHAALVLALCLSLSPRPAEAQRFGQPLQTGSAEGWPSAWAGIRAGWDYSARSTVLGAQLRVPAMPSGHVELVPNGDITFLNGLREYQGGVDAVFVSGGRVGGFYAGGGLAWRNTMWKNGSSRETRRVPVTLAGLRTGRLSGAPFGAQVEMRWIWVDGPLKPRILTLGINFPLWGGGRR